MPTLSHDPDQRLLSELRRPPHPDEVRESLAFWRRRASATRWYRRGRRREALRAVDYWEAMLVRSERAHGGPLSVARLTALAGIRPARVRRFARRLAVAATALVSGAIVAGLAGIYVLVELLA
jgi:hypothetical protein